MEKDKIFRYNDQSERYHSMNKIYILATTILWLQFIIYLLLKLNSNSIVSISLQDRDIASFSESVVKMATRKPSTNL